MKNSFIMSVFAFARSFYDAWIVLMLWGWFIVPLGAVHITYWHAYGLDVVIGLVGLPVSAVVYARTDRDDTYEQSLRCFATMLVGYTTSLGVGFAVHKFMGG